MLKQKAEYEHEYGAKAMASLTLCLDPEERDRIQRRFQCGYTPTMLEARAVELALQIAVDFLDDNK